MGAKSQRDVPSPPDDGSTAGALPITTQSDGCGHVHRVRRLQVGLVEAGVDARGGVHEVHAVDVVPVVRGVDAAVQSLAVVAEAHGRLDDELVVPLGQLEREAPAVQQLHVEGPPVEPERLERDRLEVEEGGAAAAGPARSWSTERNVDWSRVRSSATSYDVTVSSSRGRPPRRAGGTRAGRSPDQRMSRPATICARWCVSPSINLKGSLPCPHRSSVAAAACSPP